MVERRFPPANFQCPALDLQLMDKPMWVNHSLKVNQPGEFSLSSFRRRQMSSKLQLAISVGVERSGECLRSKGRHGSCGLQVKLCDPLAIGPYLSALQMRFMTKRYTNRRSLLFYSLSLFF